MKIKVVFSFCILIFASNFAFSHPHMFIDVSLKFMLSDSGLDGFYVYWKTDEMNGAWIIEEYDKNRNKRFEKNEQNNIFNKAFKNAAKDNYFLILSWGLKTLNTVNIDHFSVSIKPGNSILYAFHVPCNLDIAAITGKDIVLFFDDPSIYIAFEIKKDLIQVSSNDHIEGSVSFKKIDYSDAIVLRLKRK